MITLDDARLVISAAERKAREIGQPMNIAVVDSAVEISNARAVNALLIEISMLPGHAPSFSDMG
jgi:uncharacterized protein GlcG (DUF336 family)